MTSVLEKWISDGRPIDDHGIPHEAKAHIILTHAQENGLRVFVETGTCHGAMVEAVAPEFDQVFTVEMFAQNYRSAAKKLSYLSNVECFYGDSPPFLSDLVEQLQRPALVFLDAHYSGGGTARGSPP